MAFATLNGLPVLAAELHFPRTGVWTFQVRTDTPDGKALKGSLVFQTSDGALTLKGVGLRAGSAWETGLVTGVVGRGGMGKPCTPKAYLFPTRRTVVRDLLKDAGETLSPKSSSAVLDQSLPAWSTLGMHPVGVALNYLLRNTGAYWRTNPDGTIWIGKDDYSIDVGSRKDLVVLDARPQVGDFHVAFDSLNVFPGVRFKGLPLDYVVHSIKPDQIASHLQLRV